LAHTAALFCIVSIVSGRYKNPLQRSSTSSGTKQQSDRQAKQANKSVRLTRQLGWPACFVFGLLQNLLFQVDFVPTNTL